MRLEPTLNVTLEESLTGIPTVVRRETGEQAQERETLGTSSETVYMDIPSTQVKTIPKVTQRDLQLFVEQKEASQAEVLASTRQFFATIDQRNTNIPAGDQRTPTEVCARDNVEVSEVTTTTVVTTTISTPTSPNIVDIQSERNQKPLDKFT